MDLIGKAVVGALVVEEADIVFRCYWFVARKKKTKFQKSNNKIRSLSVCLARENEPGRRLC